MGSPSARAQRIPLYTHRSTMPRISEREDVLLQTLTYALGCIDSSNDSLFETLYTLVQELDEENSEDGQQYVTHVGARSRLILTARVLVVGKEMWNWRQLVSKETS